MPSGESGGGRRFAVKRRPEASGVHTAARPARSLTHPHAVMPVGSFVSVERRRPRQPRQLAAGVRATMRLQKERVDTVGAMV